MKKHLLLLAGALLATSAINAQLTLNSTSYTTAAAPATDSFLSTTGSSTYPSFAAATSATWDASTLTNGTTYSTAFRVPATILSATYADSNFYSLGTYNYQGNVLSAITSTGMKQYGVVIPKAAFVLPTSTSDSLWISAQTDTFSANNTVIHFPATISSSWGSNYNFSTQFVLTVGILSYTNAPGYIKSYIHKLDTVIGWGMLRVKTASGGASGYMSVLQVRTQSTRTDSFFVNGAPATSTLLGGLGLTQGQVTKTYEQNFYRVNEISPLLNVQFSDSANTTPTSATTHEQRLATTAVSSVKNIAGIRIYPNPVTGRVVSVDAATVAGEWKYNLINAAGQIVAADAMDMSNGHAQVTLAATLAPGIYHICVINGSNVVIKQLEIR